MHTINQRSVARRWGWLTALERLEKDFSFSCNSDVTLQTLAVNTFYCDLYSMEIIVHMRQTWGKGLSLGKVGESLKVLELRGRAGNHSPDIKFHSRSSPYDAQGVGRRSDFFFYFK